MIPMALLLSTVGSQDGLSKVFDMLLDPGDVVLTETPTYRYLLLPVVGNAIVEP